MIKTLDRTTVKALRPQVEQALKVLAANGLQVEVGNARFDSTSVEFKVKLVLGTSSEDAERQQFVKNAFRFGFAPEHYGANLSFAGESYKLVGIDPTKRTKCIQVRRVRDNKTFVMVPEMARSLLAK